MNKKLLLKGMIKGMEDMGASFVKVDDFDFFFNIKIGSEIDNDEKLKKARDSFMKSFGMGIKVRRINNVKHD